MVAPAYLVKRWNNSTAKTMNEVVALQNWEKMLITNNI